jgi:hypothetical protein
MSRALSLSLQVILIDANILISSARHSARLARSAIEGSGSVGIPLRYLVPDAHLAALAVDKGGHFAPPAATLRGFRTFALGSPRVKPAYLRGLCAVPRNRQAVAGAKVWVEDQRCIPPTAPLGRGKGGGQRFLWLVSSTCTGSLSTSSAQIRRRVSSAPAVRVCDHSLDVPLFWSQGITAATVAWVTSMVSVWPRASARRVGPRVYRDPKLLRPSSGRPT